MKKTIKNAVEILYFANRKNVEFASDRSLEAKAYADVISRNFRKYVKVTTVEKYLRNLRADS